MFLKVFSQSIKIIGKRNCSKIISFSLLLMFFEVFGVALILPLLDIVLNEKSVLLEKYFFIKEYFIYNEHNFLIYLLVFFIIFFIIKSLFLVFINRTFLKFVYLLRVNIQKKLLKNFLNRSYDFHLKKNSSELINIIGNEVNIFSGSALLPITSLISEIFISLGLLLLLILYEPLGFLYMLITVLVPALLFYKLTKNKQSQFGILRNIHDELSIKHLQQGILGVREIKISNKETEFVNIYANQTSHSSYYISKSLSWQAYTKIILEFITALSVSSLVVFFIFINKEKIEIVSLIGLFGLAVFRLLPSLNRIINSLQSINFASNATEIVYKNLHVKEDIFDGNLKEILQFKEKIFLEKVFFKYPSSKIYVLQNVDLIINKGEFIGIIGSSGSGKSTLVDLIAGLLKPTSGNLYVDNLKLPIDKSEKKIDCAYVSQNVFLIDDTIKRNIAFGVDDNEIDINKIERCINYAQLDDFISQLPEGYETVVGERGVKISGGQKQRIGIARALYNDSNLLIFDEATNALDHKTEEELFSTIFKMKHKKTIIFITHKELSLKNFDKIYEIENAELKIKKDI